MALSSSTVWEVRTTGAATNGGGFDANRINTQAQLSVADAACANAVTTTVTSVTGGFVAGMVGAQVKLSGGAGFDPNRVYYKIASVVDTNTITLDRNPVAAGSSSASGGALKVGGVDYCQQDAAQVAVTDAVGNGTTTVTSATANFTANHVGNTVYLAGGTGSLAAVRCQIQSVTNGTTVVLDASIATGTGIALNLGGALDSPATLFTAFVASNRAFIKAGTYTTTAGFTSAALAVTPSATAPHSRLSGYNTTRGDLVIGSGLTRPVLQITAGNSNVTLLTLSNAGWWVEGLTIDCNAQTSSNCMATASGGNVVLRNNRFLNWRNLGVSLQAVSSARYNEFTGGNSISNAAINLVSSSEAIGNWIHDMTGPGAILNQGGGNLFAFNIVTNILGSTSGDGIRYGGANFVLFNTVHGCARHCLSHTDNFFQNQVILGNLLSTPGSAGYCHVVANSAAGIPDNPFIDGNAHWVNGGLAARNNAGDAGAADPVNAYAVYTPTRDVTLTTDPFTAKATNDYSLNASVGGGASCKGVAPLDAWPGLTPTATVDMGAIQSAPPAGGGGVHFVGLAGGF